MSEMIQTVEPQSTPQIDADYSRFRADVYALLGSLLSRAPDEGLLGWLREIELEDDDTSAMHEAWLVLKLAAERADQAQVADEYQALFIGIGRGELMPYGSWYLTGFMMERPLIALRNELSALGFERQSEVKEPEDHIAALCQVMAMLVHPEEDYPPGRQQQFFNHHMQSWSAQLFRDMQQAQSAHFYSAVGRFGEVFLEQEALLLEA
ncbi:TorD/DmsD family molecular chaperone [Motiliproteus sediminis]|uniref:TorD/DmsD family molecular chaperone n=1 Tax=Motiliproteus sediminis TaxID=1468178 RepID=UPI001FEB755D|nr:molecular chaperone TorD family protein [Motiliproteus sediminis]